jgi:hypothetical protein
VATNFPSSLDSLTNPTSTDALNSPSHADQHANVNDAVEALEAKVGVDGSAVTTSLDYKVTASKTVTDKIDPAGASANQVLQYNGTKFVPATVSGGIPDTIFDAKGDLIAASAPDTAARLPVGTNGQFLAANSATSTGLEWQTISVMPNFEDDQNILANQVFS